MKDIPLIILVPVAIAVFIAGAVFLSAAYLKPAPQNPSQKSWSTVGAVAAGSLAVAAAIGFGLLIYALHDRNADLRLVTDMRIKAARAESNQRQWEEVDRRLAAEAAAAEDGAE